MVDRNATLKPGSAKVEVIKNTFLELFSSPRSNDEEKDPIREKVLQLFKKFGMETVRQEFTMSGYPGVNLIGIRPGKKRLEGKGDSIIVVASHYDSVNKAPGVDDNGSGSTAVVEVARMLYESGAELDHTVIFLCNDLEELGLLGSKAFVTEYLVPKELKKKGVTFLGAYAMG